MFGNGKGKNKGWNIFFSTEDVCEKTPSPQKQGRGLKQRGHRAWRTTLTDPARDRAQWAAEYWLLWGCASGDGKGKQSFPKVSSDMKEHSNQQCSNHNKKHLRTRLSSQNSALESETEVGNCSSPVGRHFSYKLLVKLPPTSCTCN